VASARGAFTFARARDQGAHSRFLISILPSLEDSSVLMIASQCGVI